MTPGPSERGICQNCKKPFVIAEEDFGWYKKFEVPPPTWCPICRMQRRMVFRNDRNLFRAKSGLSGKSILTLYPPEAGYTVYDNDEWWGDRWDPLDYGRDFDPSRPFLVQFRELMLAVPKFSSSVYAMVNSEYSANASYLKNCYLLFNSNMSEDSCYGNGVDKCRLCFDNSHIQSSKRCYGSFWLTNCYEAHFSSRVEDCHNVWFSKDCRGCSDCVGCVNLRMKKYCIFNRQHSKEEYQTELKRLEFHKYSQLSTFQKQARDFWSKFPNKFLEGAQNKDVSGEFIVNSKNVKRGYIIRECENLAYCQYSQVPSSKDCFDCSLIGFNAELIYEGCVCGWTGARMKFCYECWDGPHDLEYCMFCRGRSSNLFGCVGMQSGQYRILNKPYAKDDFFALREKIITHMSEMPYIDPQGRVYPYGEFFPSEFSPLAYNQSITGEHLALSKEEALARGFRWQDPNPSEYRTTMDAKDVPDSIHEIGDSILKEIIKCEECGRAYRFIPQELQFLKQVGVAAPHACVDCRHNRRIAQRNPALFYERECQCAGQKSEGGIYQNATPHFHGSDRCPNKFVTSYATGQPEIVYCEPCYQAEVV